MVPLRRCLTVAAVTAAAFLCLTMLVAGGFGPLLRADAAVSSAALRLARTYPTWRGIAAMVTTTGGPAVVTAAATVAVVCFAAVGRRRDAAFVAVTMLGSTLLRLLVLNAVARPRPADRLAASSGFSFPSGHTTGSATAALTALAVLWPFLGGRRRVVVTCTVVPWAVAVGVSRVALVVHWPTDVLGGWLLATSVVMAGLPILRRPVGRLKPAASPAQESGGGDRGAAGEGRASSEVPGPDAVRARTTARATWRSRRSPAAAHAIRPR